MTLAGVGNKKNKMLLSAFSNIPNKVLKICNSQNIVSFEMSKLLAFYSTGNLLYSVLEYSFAISSLLIVVVLG